MNPKTLLPLAVAVTGVPLFAAEIERPPNIVYFFCDDLGIGDVKCYNPQSKIETPHIDALAAAGMQFNDAHTSSAVCTPSRYNLMTGRYPWRTVMKSGVNGTFSRPLLTPGRLTVAAMLKKQGYTTGMVGKWHLGMDWPVKPNTTGKQPGLKLDGKADNAFGESVDYTRPAANGPCDFGFDSWFGISASSDMAPYFFIQDRTPVDTPTVPIKGTSAEMRARGGMRTPGWRHDAVIPAFREKSLAYIQSHAKDTAPFFLYIPVSGPHTPVAPSAAFKGKSKVGIYGDFVMEIDAMLGDLVAQLKKDGIYDNTLFILSSDNGPETIMRNYPEKYDHNCAGIYRGMKRSAWEGGHRVPLIASWPAKVKAGVKSNALVEVGDFMATAADITRFKMPADAAEDSFSFLPILEGKADSVRTMAIHQSSLGNLTYREGDWKLMLHSGSGADSYKNDDGAPVQLYNMKDDVCETINVYREHPEVVKRLYDKAVKAISEGRTTPGVAQSMGDLKSYRQYQQILGLEQKKIF